ncbi:MAG: Ran-binding zinc finger domain-containing protein [Bacteroidota bacterium]
MAIRVGRWDCTVCGTKGNLGPETRCHNCGSPRPENVRFYLPTDAEIVEDEVRLEEAKAGPDWICGHCSNQNKHVHLICQSCGNPRDEKSEDVDLQVREYKTGEVPEESFERERTIHPLEKARQQRAVPKRKHPLRWLLLAGLILFGGYLFLRSVPRQVDANIDQFKWERTLQVLHNEAVQHEDWSHPANAFDVSSFRAIHHYDQVLRGYETRTRTVQVPVGEERYVCGQRDRGNGYFEDVYCSRTIYENRQENYEEPIYEQVPVFQTKYRYKVMEWVARAENLLHSSADDQKPQWPSVPSVKSGRNWKNGDRTEKYYILIRENNGSQHLEQISYDLWKGLSPGETVKIKKAYLFGWYFGLVDNGW